VKTIRNNSILFIAIVLRYSPSIYAPTGAPRYWRNYYRVQYIILVAKRLYRVELARTVRLKSRASSPFIEAVSR